MSDSHADPPQVYYVDAARSHEVWAMVERREGGLFFVTREAPYGRREEHDLVLRETAVPSTMAAQVALRELEQRLAATGARYFRMHPATSKFEPLGAVAPLDLAPQEIEVPGNDARPVIPLRVHHFHRRDGKTRFQLTLPRLDLPDERYLLADLAFEFPEIEKGEISIVHARLAPGTLRSQWVNSHTDLPREGYRKLATQADYEKAFGEGWEAHRLNAIQGAFYRLLEESERALPLATEEAIGNASDLVAPLEAAFKSPVLRVVRATYLTPGEEARVLAQGELGIRRHIQTLRKRGGHDEQFGLSLLEAALLVEYAAREARQRLLVEEGKRVIRMVSEYERVRGRAPTA